MAAISSMAKTHALAAPTSKLRRTSGLLMSPRKKGGRREEVGERRGEVRLEKGEEDMRTISLMSHYIGVMVPTDDRR
jgi:hypothetical protein